MSSPTPKGTRDFVRRITLYKQIPELTERLFIQFSLDGMPQKATLLNAEGTDIQKADITIVRWLWQRGFLYRTVERHSALEDAVLCLLCEDVKQPVNVDVFNMEEHVFRTFTHHFIFQGAPSLYKIDNLTRANFEEFINAARYNNNKKDGESLTFAEIHENPFLFLTAGGMGNINIIAAGDDVATALHTLLHEGRLRLGDFLPHPYFPVVTLHTIERVLLTEDA